MAVSCWMLAGYNMKYRGPWFYGGMVLVGGEGVFGMAGCDGGFGGWRWFGEEVSEQWCRGCFVVWVLCEGKFGGDGLSFG